MKIRNIPNHINLLRSSGLSLVNKIRLHFKERFKPFEMKFFGNQIKILDAASFLGMFTEIYLDKFYYFKSQTAQPLIIDCGANIGLSVIYFKKLFPQAIIEAYEPAPEVYNCLEQNVKAFGFDAVFLKKNAVWIANEKLKFNNQGGTSGALGVNEGINTVEVDAIRLKDVLLNRKVDFLKIDIEGAEYEVLKDCTDSLSNVKNLFIEYHSFIEQPQVLNEILYILSQSGFRYQIKEAYNSELPFVERKNQLNMDLQLNIFAYRE